MMRCYAYKLNKILTLAFILLTLSGARTGAAQPMKQLRSIETEHYLIQTDLLDNDLAPYLRVLEEVHNDLATRMGTVDYGKFVIFLTDNRLRYEVAGRGFRSEVLENAEGAIAAGKYLPQLCQVDALHRPADPTSSLVALAHEATHQYHHSFAGDDAMYVSNRLYSEGVAELVAAGVEKRWDYGHAVISDPGALTNSLRGFRGEPSLTVATLGRGEFKFDQRTYRYLHDLGWSLCGFLDTHYPDRFRKYCRLIDAPNAVGLSMAEAWQRAFGDLDDKQLTAEMIAWLSGLAEDVPVAYVLGNWRENAGVWTIRSSANDLAPRADLILRHLIPSDGEQVDIEVVRTDSSATGKAGVIFDAIKFDNRAELYSTKRGLINTTRRWSYWKSSKRAFAEPNITGPLTGPGFVKNPAAYHVLIRRDGEVLTISVDGQVVMKQANRGGMIGFFCEGDAAAEFRVTRDKGPATRPAGA